MMRWLHRDAWLIAVDKPSGLLAVPGRGADKADCVLARAAAALAEEAGAAADAPRPLVVHRLDRDTSGVMIFGLDPATQRALSGAFAGRRVAKRYLAVVRGRVDPDTGCIDAPIRKDMTRKYVHIVDPQHGKPARTRWRVLDRQADRTRLELTPTTGRSHQLRVHLAHLGHPVLGDPLYGDAGAAARLMLHAASLQLDHPHTGRPLELASPCPF